MRPSRPHIFDDSGIVRAGRPHHNAAESNLESRPLPSNRANLSRSAVRLVELQQSILDVPEIIKTAQAPPVP